MIYTLNLQLLPSFYFERSENYHYHSQLLSLFSSFLIADLSHLGALFHHNEWLRWTNCVKVESWGQPAGHPFSSVQPILSMVIGPRDESSQSVTVWSVYSETSYEKSDIRGVFDFDF